MIWFFALLFLTGVVGSSVVITRKIPLVLATPRQVIDDYFQQESARVHIRVLRVRAWLQSGAYWDPILLGLLCLLRIIRIGAMKLERYTFVIMQKVNEIYEARKTNGNGKPAAEEAAESAPKFWSELRERTTKDTDSNL